MFSTYPVIIDETFKNKYIRLMTFIYREFRNHSHDRTPFYKTTHMIGHPFIRPLT
jgi:hypothetical protein